MNSLEASLNAACDAVPGVVTGALALVPEGVLLAGVGSGSALEQQPLVRSAARLVDGRAQLSSRLSPFVEYAFVSDEQLVVITRGLRNPRLALALACKREANLALVMRSARRALSVVEDSVDFSRWEVAP